jgi:hypothetical protein
MDPLIFAKPAGSIRKCNGSHTLHADPTNTLAPTRSPTDPTLDPIWSGSTRPAGATGKCNGPHALHVDPTATLAPVGSPTGPNGSYTESHPVGLHKAGRIQINAMDPLLDPNTLAELPLFMCCLVKIKKGPPWQAGRRVLVAWIPLLRHTALCFPQWILLLRNSGRELPHWIL